MTPIEWAFKFCQEVAVTGVRASDLEPYFAKAIAEERERDAKIAESMAIPGHNVQEPSCMEIARRIRES
jgi:hypothetical protein